jgi:hypothetical protein
MTKERVMKSSLVVLGALLASAPSWGEILPETEHYSEAAALDSMLTAVGACGSVLIYDESYLVGFQADFDEMPGETIGLVIGAVGDLSSSATWSSNYVLVSFCDISFSMTTEACRELNEMALQGVESSEMEDFLCENLVQLEGYEQYTDEVDPKKQ